MCHTRSAILPRRAIVRHVVKLREDGGEFVSQSFFGAGLRIGTNRLIEICLAGSDSDFCKFGIGDIKERAAEDGGKFDISLGIIEDAQKRDAVGDLGGLEIAAGALRAYRHTHKTQNADVVARLVGGAAHQNHDIAVINIAVGICGLIENLKLASANHLPYAAADQGGLHFDSRKDDLFLRKFAVVIFFVNHRPHRHQ